MEKVSIVVPVYNAEKFISRTIDSILEQTYNNIEVILVDDGSTDRSYEICNRYAKYNSNILLLYQKNSGPGAAKNSGIKKSTGEYILFLDCDDTLIDDAIQNLVMQMKSSGSDMVIPIKYNVIDENDNFIAQKYHFDERMILTNPCEFALKIMMGAGRGWRSHSLLFNKKRLVDNNIYFLDRSMVDDFFFNLSCMEKFHKIEFIDISTVNYRKRNGSITNTFFENWCEMIWKFYDAGEKFIDDMNLDKSINQQYVYSMTIRTSINYLIDIFSYKNTMSFQKKIKFANDIFKSNRMYYIYENGTAKYIMFPKSGVTYFYRLIFWLIKNKLFYLAYLFSMIGSYMKK